MDTKPLLSAPPTKLPEYDPSLTSVWLKQLDLACLSEGLTTEQDKFRRGFLALGTRTAELVADISLSSDLPYTTFCERLRTLHDPVLGTTLTQVLTAPSLDGQQPSTFLRKLRRILPDNTPETLFRHLLLMALPDSIRLTVASHDVPVDQLAVLADRLLPYSLTASVSATVTKTPSSDSSDDETAVIGLKSRNLRPPPQRRNNKTTRRSSLCFYHLRFGLNANKCELPCSWNTKKAKNESARPQRR
ncbi:hypothetical protein GE061_005321 [Apolygus lucorum]|uniref:Uncharacterized protein n=1 Tax=Apolygus lucorum TaxID=248454 RepID=A0A8S9WW10_APOLU|nr:hypothetical protein GE061_005320 [Apolygus lucorum]KAF6200874.1 hypothetical protein GE061_005321 [Apolygus lucorum]